MLALQGIYAGYDTVQVLFDVSLVANAGEITCLVGRNGAGKTTTLRTIMGLVKPTQGNIEVNGVRVDNIAAHKIPKLGVAYVPQGRGLFAELSVAQNLEVALMAGRAKSNTKKDAPDLLLLDEPTEGLQPSFAHLIKEVAVTLKERGVAIVLVEQHIDTITAIADQVVYLENGRVPERLSGDQLRADPGSLKRYLGMG